MCVLSDVCTTSFHLNSPLKESGSEEDCHYSQARMPQVTVWTSLPHCESMKLPRSRRRWLTTKSTITTKVDYLVARKEKGCSEGQLRRRRSEVITEWRGNECTNAKKEASEEESEWANERANEQTTGERWTEGWRMYGMECRQVERCWPAAVTVLERKERKRERKASTPVAKKQSLSRRKRVTTSQWVNE